jgi:hypothetical protein
VKTLAMEDIYFDGRSFYRGDIKLLSILPIMLLGDNKMNLIFWKKLPISRLFILIALVGLTGCTSLNTALNSLNGNTNSDYVGQPNVYEDGPNSDDAPYAIQQYLDQLKVAQNNQSDEQAILEKSEAGRYPHLK